MTRSYMLRGLYGPLMDLTVIATMVGIYESLQEV